MENFVDELLLQVFQYLNVEDLLSAKVTCNKWYYIAESRILWKRLVLQRWSSQTWLYSTIPVNSLNWLKIYQEFTQYSWYSPDHMQYFVTCCTMEQEPIAYSLRERFFVKMAEISGKWLQATPLDHDGDMIQRHFDQNMELFFDIRQLKWTFLDKRRGYIRKLYSPNSRKGQAEGSSNPKYFIRPYQVVPSCLLMYRILCMFRSLAVPQTGLTFYRIWRFRLKHATTGMIFEFCDWKAAASNTFSNGCPNIASFREDALELINFLTHPHFIMHPFGLDPRLERVFHYSIRASAGGCADMKQSKRKRKNASSRRHRTHDNLGGSELLSPHVKAAVLFGKQLYEKPMFPDIEDKLERWRARRRLGMNAQSSCVTLDCHLEIGGSTLSSRASSYSTLFSEPESACDSTAEDSQKELTTSDSTCSDDSQDDDYENGYVTNCKYFISNMENFDSIEDQHSLQASIADLWMVNEDQCTDKIPVVYDVDDATWYFDIELTRPKDLSLQFREKEATGSGQCITDNSQDHESRSKPILQSSQIPSSLDEADCLLAGTSSSTSTSCSACSLLTGDVIEPLPSPLALYRLICLFEFNSPAYISVDEDFDTCVWKVSILHKKTSGVVHFQDHNGLFRVFVSPPNHQPHNSANILTSQADSFVAMDTTQDGDFIHETSSDLSDFRSAVAQLLDLLMSEGFCHPYGIIAGTVA